MSGDQEFTPAPITEASGAFAFDTLRNAVGMLSLFDWQGCVDAIGRTHSVGHILDPTRYKDYIFSPHTEHNEKLVKITAKFLAEVRGVADDAREKEARRAVLRHGGG